MVTATWIHRKDNRVEACFPAKIQPYTFEYIWIRKVVFQSFWKKNKPTQLRKTLIKSYSKRWFTGPLNLRLENLTELTCDSVNSAHFGQGPSQIRGHLVTYERTLRTVLFFLVFFLCLYFLYVNLLLYIHFFTTIKFYCNQRYKLQEDKNHQLGKKLPR